MAERKPPAKKVDPREEMGLVISRTDQDRPFVTSNRFHAAHVEVKGREMLALSPINWVGPPPIVVMFDQLPELVAVLEALAAEPGPENPNDA